MTAHSPVGGGVPRPSTFRVWLTASRPRTLWVGASPVITACGLTWRDQTFHLPSAVAALIGALAIQVMTNLANDLSDFRRGADSPERTGPLRVTQAGWVTPRQMQTAIGATVAVALAAGIYLVTRAGWPIVVIGLSSITAGLLYTGGPRPFGYYGLGDMFVFVFFGLVATVGTYYVQALSTPPAAWLAALPMGGFATAVLVVNNLRDLDSDRAAGKRTLAVHLGRRGTIVEYSLLLAVTLLIPIAMIAFGLGRTPTLLSLGPAVVAALTIRVLARARDGPAHNRVLAQLTRLQALYAATFAVGINL